MPRPGGDDVTTKADAVVYAGEADRKCAGSARRMVAPAGGFSSDGVAWVQCPVCGAELPHRDGYAARSIPAHNAPRVLARRPSWARATP
jgi:hypothetical protein